MLYTNNVADVFEAAPIPTSPAELISMVLGADTLPIFPLSGTCIPDPDNVRPAVSVPFTIDFKINSESSVPSETSVALAAILADVNC